MGDLFPVFKETRVKVPFWHRPLGQVTLIQNNQYGTVGYFGVACHGP